MRQSMSLRTVLSLLTLAILLVPATALVADGTPQQTGPDREQDATVVGPEADASNAASTPKVDFTDPHLGILPQSSPADAPPGCGECGTGDWDQDCSCYSEHYCDGGPTFCESYICDCIYL